MKKNKKLFIYKNRIILTNGSSLKITSIKYIKKYQLNVNLFQQKINNIVKNKILTKKNNFFI